MPETSSKIRPHPSKTPRDDRAAPMRSSAGDPQYVELQVTSNFTFLTGASHPDELVQQAAELGHHAAAIADTNSLAGIVRAHVAAKEIGLPLAVGCRLVAAAQGEMQVQLLVYPTDRAAYGRLCQLLTLGKRRAPKGECHLTLHDVLDHHEGLLAVVIPPTVLDQPFIDVLLGLKRCFNDDRLSLASSCLYGPDDRGRLRQLADLAHHVGVPLVATNDVHYHAPQRRALQDVLTCIRHGCTIDQAGWRLFAHAERYLKSPAEMARLFADHPEALSRTVQIADRAAQFSLDELRYEYPDELVPPGMTAMEHLVELTWKGAVEIYEKGTKGQRDTSFPHKRESSDCAMSARPSRASACSGTTKHHPLCPSVPQSLSPFTPPPAVVANVPAKVIQQIIHEFRLIDELNYAPYFLTVHDLVIFARSRGILCQGRGAAANSAVCYCLGVTAVDPDRIDMLFERFISKERNEPPDIDIDFEHERREEVIQYIYNKYGRDRAALTAEVITYRGRSAIRDVGKALGLSLESVDQLAKSTDWWEAGPINLERLRELGFDASDARLLRVIELAWEVLGFPRHLSQHVGGFVITRDRLDRMVPVENAAMQDRTVIEWDKDDIDALDMLKVDVLGLGMLTVIRKAFDMLNEKGEGKIEIAQRDRDERASQESLSPSVPLSLHSIPPEDSAVYDMICRADTIGVFQIESRAQMSMLPRLRPRCFYDLVIEVAIVRPGPIQGDMVHPYLRRRSGEEPIHYPDERVKRVLGRTLGVPLFQEQAMSLAVAAAGFTPGEADRLRRAIAAWKQKAHVLEHFEQRIIEGMVAHGYERSFAEQCFTQIKGFSGYGFPESHAASFALLVYVSAWLKCHHPDAFAAALINSQPMGFYQPAQIVRDAKEHGVEVRPVDVNYSAWDCVLEGPPAEPGGKALRLGMRLVRGMREDDAHAIAAAVARHGKFGSIHALHRASGVRVASLRRLASAGAFGSMGLDRQAALWQVRKLRDEALPMFDDVDDATLQRIQAEEERQVTLPPVPELRNVTRDYAAVGLTLRDHPISFIRDELDRRGAVTAATLRDEKAMPHGSPVAVAGLVLVRQRPATASGVVFMTIEDETGVANLIIRPKVYERFRQAARSAMILVRGRVERQGEVIHVMTHSIEPLRLREEIGSRSRDFH